MNGRWTIPRYFENDIVAGSGDYFSEWIRVYTPGQWQPVADFTIGPPPELRYTYREWQKFYHFEVLDSTEGTSAGRSLMRPFTPGITVIGTPEDGNDSLIQHRSLSRPLSQPVRLQPS